MEPDVYISKDGDDYLIQINDEDVPQLRLNPQYRRMLDRNQEPDKEVRNYVKERYAREAWFALPREVAAYVRADSASRERAAMAS